MNQVALITGGAKRIGKSICLYLAKNHYDIIFTYHTSTQEANQLQSTLTQIGIKAIAIKWDFSKPANLDLLYKKIEKHFPKIDLLINNAAIFFPDNIKTFNYKNLYQLLLVNTFSPLLLTHHQILHNPKSHIISILDNRIAFHDKNYISYSLSKKFLQQGLLHFTALSPPQCRLNAIAPAAIVAPCNQRDITISGSKKLKNINREEQLISAIDFFLKNSYINGETLFLDGKTRFSF